MKICATTTFTIIGIIIIVIVIMIVSYTFKIIEAGNNEPFWVTPSLHVNNTVTLYLGHQHGLVRNSVGFFFLFPYVPVCQPFKH